MSSHVMTCHTSHSRLSCHVMSCYVMSWHVMSCHCHAQQIFMSSHDCCPCVHHGYCALGVLRVYCPMCLSILIGSGAWRRRGGGRPSRGGCSRWDAGDAESTPGTPHQHLCPAHQHLCPTHRPALVSHSPVLPCTPALVPCTQHSCPICWHSCTMYQHQHL